MTPINKFLGDLTETEETARKIAFHYAMYLDAKQVFALEDEIKDAIRNERKTCALIAETLQAETHMQYLRDGECYTSGIEASEQIATAIRARK